MIVHMTSFSLQIAEAAFVPNETTLLDYFINVSLNGFEMLYALDQLVDVNKLAFYEANLVFFVYSICFPLFFQN